MSKRVTACIDHKELEGAEQVLVVGPSTWSQRPFVPARLSHRSEPKP